MRKNHELVSLRRQITDMRESLAKLEKKEMEVSAQAHKVDPEAVETPSPLSKKPRTGDV